MRTTISSEFDAPAAEVWRRVKRSSTFFYISSGVLGFANADAFPEEWEEGATVTAELLFFGFIPGGKHIISFRSIDDEKLWLSTEETSGLVSSWNHSITVVPIDERRCVYTDDVEMHAGPMTLLVWLYSQVLYRYRQRRWRSLLKTALKLKQATKRSS